MLAHHKIMVVDDEKDILRLISQRLKSYRFETESFSDGISALRHFQNNPASYSLVISDIRMPGMTGIELLTLISRINPTIKSILMTAYEIDLALFENLPLVKKEDILKKPVRLDDICIEVKKRLKLPE